MSQRGGRQVRCARCAGRWQWNTALHTWGNGLRTGRKAGEEVFALKYGASYVPTPHSLPCLVEYIDAPADLFTYYITIITVSQYSIYTGRRRVNTGQTGPTFTFAQQILRQSPFPSRHGRASQAV